jgi:hypothetical protein
VPIVPTQRKTSFDEMKFSENSNGSLLSGSRDGCHISKRKDAPLAHHHQLMVKPALPTPEIKISNPKKARIGDEIFTPKN